MNLIYLLIGLVIGAVVTYLLFSFKNQSKISALENDFHEKERLLDEQRFEAQKETSLWEERHRLLKTETEGWRG
jgi:uncharacterized membrane-anchored protein YhcB (DUF1043 family)